MPLQEHLKKEKGKLKELPPKKKLEYIWDYYKIHMIVAVASIIFLFSLISSILEGSKETALSVVMLNNELAYDSEAPSLMEDFATYAGIDSTKVNLTLDTSMAINTEFNDTYSYNYNMKMMAMIQAKTLDIIIADRSLFDYYVKTGAMYPLSDITDREFLKKYKDNLITYHDDETGTDYFVGLDIADSPVIGNSGIYSDDVCLGIVSNTTQLENAIQFIDFLYK